MDYNGNRKNTKTKKSKRKTIIAPCTICTEKDYYECMDGLLQCNAYYAFCSSLNGKYKIKDIGKEKRPFTEGEYRLNEPAHNT